MASHAVRKLNQLQGGKKMLWVAQGFYKGEGRPESLRLYFLQLNETS